MRTVYADRTNLIYESSLRGKAGMPSSRKGQGDRPATRMIHYIKKLFEKHVASSGGSISAAVSNQKYLFALTWSDASQLIPFFSGGREWETPCR